MITVICPACFEEFEIAPPPPAEVPCTWDYDCEVCCRPMVIHFQRDDDEVTAEARGLGE